MQPIIRFDRKTAVFFASLVSLFVITTTLKIHGSSIGYWYGFLRPEYRSPDSGVVLGTPKLYRMDEWNIFTPAIVSQARVHPSFPISNPRWGAGEVPLVFKFPARHWSTLLRPQFWGFFLLDLERGFAFYWNIRAMLLLGGTFLWLMVLTESHFWISVLGAAWLFFSGFIQWWYSNQQLPELIGFTGLLVVISHYLVLSPDRKVIVLSGLVFLVCAFNFALALYPPYQVPLVYIGVVTAAASLVPRLSLVDMRGNTAVRMVSALFAVLGLAILLGLYYRDAKEGVDLMRNTVYPGSRAVTGGDVTIPQLFAGFFGFFMTEQHFPAYFGGNICELSNFVLLFPIPIGVMIWRAWRKQPITIVEFALAVYILVFLTWIVIGWPHWLAAASGVELSQPLRSQLSIGLGSILLCCVFLAKSQSDVPKGLGAKLVIAGVFTASFASYATYFNHVTSGFATTSETLMVVFVGGLAGYLFLARKRLAFAVCLLVPQVWSYALVNPVAVGLGPILNAKIFQEVSHFVDQDPQARWAVYLDMQSTTFLKMAGAKVFNGINIIPPMDDFRIIDPEGLAKSVYNRYGYIVLTPQRGPDITFKNVENDKYTMAIDPNNRVWRQLGIRYIVLPSASNDLDFIANTTLVPDVPGLWIYKYRS